MSRLTLARHYNIHIVNRLLETNKNYFAIVFLSPSHFYADVGASDDDDDDDDPHHFS